MNTIKKNDLDRIRSLAKEWMEVADSEEMQHRRDGWRTIRDLKGKKPLIKCDAFLIEGFVDDRELKCEDEELRSVEKLMIGKLKQYYLIGDDIVLNDIYRIPWKIDCSDYGVNAVVHQAKSGGVAYAYENPISKVEDISLLKHRTFYADRETTIRFKEKMEYVLDGIIPVRVGNVDYVFNGFGNSIMTGNNWCNPLFELFKFCGYERLMYWMMDEPEAIHALMNFFTEDKLAYLHFLEDEELLDFNTDSEFVGSVSYGFCSDLPQRDTARPARLKDIWGWVEGQEGIVISPTCYRDFVAPYMGRIAREFGHVQYGCCENHSDRYQFITKEVPNIRAFTTTYKWNNIRKLYEQCKGKQVIVCKPSPENLCSSFPMWEAFEKEMKDLLDITGGKDLEILIGDIITLNGEFSRLSEAVSRFHSIFGMENHCIHQQSANLLCE